VAAENRGTVLTVSLCRSLIHQLAVRRVYAFEKDICAIRKTVETVPASVLSLVTAINRGVNERATCSFN
jgi:hypothetical protein